MITSKVICNDTYSNKSWCIVSQGMFVLQEINQMECKMCSYLGVLVPGEVVAGWVV